MRTVGFYTVAWSSGAGFGFLTSGAFYSLGVVALATLCVLATAPIFVIVMRHKVAPEAHLREVPDQPSEEGTGRPVNPAYVWIGWITIVTVVFVQRPLQTFVPSMGAREAINGPFMTSLPLFIHMMVQGLAGLVWARMPGILYRRMPMVIVNLVAVALFLGIWLHPTFAVSFVGISILGIYAGFAFFKAVFYASNSGRRAFNIGVNEFLVGFGSLVGLFACELWMRRSGRDLDMYLFCGLALLVSTAIQWAVASWNSDGSRGVTAD
jgi:MFS family permease